MGIMGDPLDVCSEQMPAYILGFGVESCLAGDAAQIANMLQQSQSVLVAQGCRTPSAVPGAVGKGKGKLVGA